MKAHGEQARSGTSAMDKATARPSDAELLVAIAGQRSNAAFEELYPRLERHAYSLALRITNCREGAEEVVQDSMLRIWRYAHTFVPEGNARGWMLRVVAREGVLWLRKKRRQEAGVRRETWIANRPAGLEDPKPKAALLPADDREETLALLRREILKLSPVQQQLLALRYGADLTQREIGEALNLHQSMVTRRIAECLDELRASLQSGPLGALAPTLLVAERLATALRESAQAPPGLQARVLEPLRDFAQGPAFPKASGAPKLRSAAALFAGVLLALTAAWAAAQALRPQTEFQPVPAAQAAPSVAGGTQPVPASFEPRHWDFEHPGTFSVEVCAGQWKRLQSARRGTYGLVAARDTVSFLRLPVAVPARPVEVTIRFSILKLTATDRHKGTLNMNWCKDNSEVEYETRWCADPEVLTLPVGELATSRFFFFDDRIVLLAETGGASFPVQSNQYRSSYPGDKLLLTAKNVYIEDLSIRAVSLQEIPQAARLFTLPRPPKLSQTKGVEGVIRTPVNWVPQAF